MLKTLAYYKPDIQEVIQRFKSLYEAVSSGKSGYFIYRALLLDTDTKVYNTLQLNSYNFEDCAGIDRYVDDLLIVNEIAFESRKYVEDDTIPAISPILGIGDYSSFVAGSIIFGEYTSWSKPVLKKLDDWKRFEQIGSAQWYKNFILISEKILEKIKITGIPYMRGFFSPLDLAYALRGEQLFMDFYDIPDKVHEFLDFCTSATIKFAQHIKDIVYKYLGNTIYGTWFFENAINLSEDTTSMLSVQLYKEFGAPYTQRVIDYFGNGFLHCHSVALRIVPELCRLRNVKSIWIATDPNGLDPLDNLGELVEQSNGVCLSIYSDSFKRIEKVIDIAKNGNIDFCIKASSINEANRYSNLIRKYSKA